MSDHPWIVVVGVIFAFYAWLWLCRRHPLVAIFIFSFLRGLLGGRR